MYKQIPILDVLVTCHIVSVSKAEKNIKNRYTQETLALI